MKEVKHIIADNVKMYRKRGKLTQSRLAELSGLSLDTIKRIEGGKSMLSLESFLSIAAVLDAPINYLVSEKIESLPEMEQVHSILTGRSEKQKAFLLHMLRLMAEEIDKLW